MARPTVSRRRRVIVSATSDIVTRCDIVARREFGRGHFFLDSNILGGGGGDDGGGEATIKETARKTEKRDFEEA